MNTKSKIEDYLIKTINSKYNLKYEPEILTGKNFSLKIDFVLSVNNSTKYYLEYSGMNFFRKYLKLVDICTAYENVYVIFDNENLQHELNNFCKFIDENKSELSKISLNKIALRIESFYGSYKQLCI